MINKKISTRKIKLFFYLIPHFFGIILSPFIVIVIRLIRPLILIRYGLILTTRLGHMAENMDIYLCAKEKNMHNEDIEKRKNVFHIFYCRYDICNMPLLMMLKKNVIILPRFIMHWVEQCDSFLDKFVNSERIHEIGCYKRVGNTNHHFKGFFPPYISRDIHGWYENTKPQISFNKDQINIGNKLLKEMGIDTNKKIVCLYARDDRYLKSVYPNNDWSIHDYRYFDIDLFKESCFELIKRDYFVIRVGSMVEKKLIIKNNNFIDYSTSRFRSEFLDIFLAYKCNFFISTSSGIDGLPILFRRPIVWPSLFPIKDVRSSCARHMVSFRHIKSISQNKLLTLKEIMKNKYDFCYDTKIIKNNNLELCVPTQKELSDTIIDMINFLNNDFSQFDSKDEKLKNRFFEIFKNSNLSLNKIKYHNYLNFNVSRSFLRNNQWWLD